MATLRTISGFSFSSRSRLSLLLKISRLNIDPTSFYFTLNNTLRKSLQTTSVLSVTSKQCFEHFLVCSLIFIEYKCSSKASIYLTFIIYYIGQKRSRDLTLIDQYFFKKQKHPETSGCYSYIKYKIASVKRLARNPTPQKKKSTFHSLQGFPLPDNPPSSKW